MTKILLASGLLTLALMGNSALADPTLSIHNKSGNMIYVKVHSGEIGFFDKVQNYLVQEGKGIINGGFFDASPDVSQKTTVFIFKKDGNDLNEIAKADFTKNKTIYINYDGKHVPKIYPQQGPLKGWTYHTDRGYPLSNNVTQSDIHIK